jgi:hypothetical protein
MAVSCSDSERELESVVGDNARDEDVGRARDTLDAVGVFAGDDFVGEMDLARSDELLVSDILTCGDGCAVAAPWSISCCILLHMGRRTRAHLIAVPVVPFYLAESLPRASYCALRPPDPFCRPTP